MPPPLPPPPGSNNGAKAWRLAIDYDMTKSTLNPPTNFELSPKGLTKPNVEFVKSRGTFGDSVRWSDITKILKIPSKTVLLEMLFGVSV